jgi:hypothetical protein
MCGLKIVVQAGKGSGGGEKSSQHDPAEGHIGTFPSKSSAGAASGQDEKPFFRVPRDLFFCKTTRNDSDERVVNREERAEKGNFAQILGGLKPFRAMEEGIWEA